MIFRVLPSPIIALLAAVFIALPSLAAVPPPVAGARPVGVRHIQVHSPSLEGNLDGESASRNVIVYLPPDYDKDPARRYPVVYALHGYSLTAEGFAGLLQSPRTVENAFALGTPGMIVVLPDTQTRHNGSMYSSSVTTGDWEGFIADDLVRYIDTHYRTIPQRTSRGLAGHSMGGYGTARIGMKRPDVFGALYIMSPCCLPVRGAPPADVLSRLQALDSPDEARQLDFMGRATLAVAAAWSPNPARPPFFLDLPSADGSDPQSVLSRWAANAPLAMIDQYRFNLGRYRAIAIDVGAQDNLLQDASSLHQRMDELGLTASFQIYSGDHGNAVPDRFQNHVLPFFGRNLATDMGRR